MNSRGQMYVLEAIIAGFVLLGAIIAAQSIRSPAAPAADTLAQLKATGDDALRALDQTPPGTPQEDYDHTNSTLVQYIADDRTGKMQAFLDQALPSNARYEVRLRNATTAVTWIAGSPPAEGNIVVSHRIIAVRDPPLGLEGTILDVQLKLWSV